MSEQEQGGASQASHKRAQQLVHHVVWVGRVKYCRLISAAGDILAEGGDLDALSRPALVFDDMDTLAERSASLAEFRARELSPHMASRGKTRGVYMFVDADTFVQMFFEHAGDVGDFFARATTLASLVLQIDNELS